MEAVVPYKPESDAEVGLEPSDTAKVLKKSQDGNISNHHLIITHRINLEWKVLDS